MASFALEHLTFTYPGQTRPALSDLTLTIPEGHNCFSDRQGFWCG